VTEPVAYHFDALSSNSMKSSNPDSGVNEVDQARTLDTWRPDPSLNQGGLAIVEPFVKSSRAQTSEDSETWISGEVNPTLNSFDQGDVRATTAIVQPIQMKNNPVKEIVGSLQARVTATNHESIRDGHAIVVEPVMLNYQGSKGNSVTSEDGLSFSLNAMHGHDVHVITEPMLIDGTRVNDVRVYSEPVQTLKERMGTGGNNVPMLAFDTQFGSNANVTEEVSPTLKSSQAPPSVAYGITGNAIGRQDHNGPNGPSHTPEGGPMFTLTGTDIHAVAVQYDGYNQTVNTTDVSQSLRIGRDSSDFIAQPTEPTVFQPGTMVRLNGGVWEGTVPTLRAEAKRGDNEPHIQIHDAEPTMAVRRLTPLECERLMGWPDDHTRYKADGTEQADTHRYKQCGNGVASPVAQWIAKHLLKVAFAVPCTGIPRTL
jgi:hypothetical protein